MRRKGELSPARIDREWPYQVALPAKLVGAKHSIIEKAKSELAGCSRGHSVRHNDIGYVVYCFATPEAADKFEKQFDGEPFDPKDRGPEWWRWRKPDLANRRKPMLDAAKNRQEIIDQLQVALSLADKAHQSVLAYLIQLALDEAQRKDIDN